MREACQIPVPYSANPDHDARSCETAAAAAGTASLLTAAEGSQEIKVGLVGCGGRGTGAAAQALQADDFAVLTAVADVEQDRIDRCLEEVEGRHEGKRKVRVAKRRQFLGLDAFQGVIDSGVDVVLLATPPGFRPQHLKACIDAGKHVFCEKPMAVDAPGVRSVLETAKLAGSKRLSLVAGFCWRYNNMIIEAMDRVHSGEIGDILAYYATYYTNPVKPMPPGLRAAAGHERRRVADPQLVQLRLALRRWLGRAGRSQRRQDRLGLRRRAARELRGGRR